MLFPKNSRGNKRKYSDEFLLALAEAKKVNSYRQAGKLFGLSGASVYQLLKKYKLLEVKSEIVPKNYIHIQKYAELHNETYSSIYWHIKQGNLHHKKINSLIYINAQENIDRRGISQKKIDKILSLSKKDFSYRKIGRIVKCSPITVKNYIELLGD